LTLSAEPGYKSGSGDRSLKVLCYIQIVVAHSISSSNIALTAGCY